MPEFVDAHHHLWDLNHCCYPWLEARGVKRFFGDPTPIQKNYLPQDFLAESPRWVPQNSVHIQVGVEGSDSLKESQWLQSLADKSGDGIIPGAIVAFVDLAAPDVAERLEHQMAVSNFRGVRQIVGRHPEEDRETGSGGLIDMPAFTAGLRCLAELELSFDLQLVESQYEATFALLRQIPGLNVALCHFGSPWDQTPAGFQRWRVALQRFAQLENFHCKLSGMGMFDAAWTIEGVRPWFLEVLEIFGVERVMLGSNFPVDKLYGSYERVWEAYETVFGDLTAAEQERLFRRNAEGFYRL